MKALVLGGNSPHHRQWIRRVKQALEPDFEEVRLHDYHHWTTGAPNTDLECEIRKITKTIVDFDDYIIVAKSIGTAITILGNARGVITPKAALLMGLPLRSYMSGRPEVAESLAKLPKTIFLQNRDDPFGNSKDAASYIRSHPPTKWKIEVTDGDTHDYTDFDIIAKLANELHTSF